MEEKKLTDEVVAENATTDEIIKAISYLAETGEGRGWIDGYKCKVIKFADVLDLIHRLQDENERLTEENAILKGNPPILAGRSLGKTIRAKLLAFDRMKEQNAELQKQVDELKEENGKLVTIGNGFALERNNLREELDELKKELSNVPDPFPCKIGSGCEAAGQGCYDCPNNRYRQQVAKEILQRGKYCMPSGLRDWIKEHYDVEV